MEITASKIQLEAMRFYAYHGVMAQERQTGGYYRVGLTVEADVTAAVASDDVADTIDYSRLYAIVEREMAVTSKLLEHVAGRIARSVIDADERITALTVSVTKENPPMGADSKGASVEIKVKR